MRIGEMNTQPEALRLAEQLRDLSTMFKTASHSKGVCNGANQELRRLHDVELHLKQVEKDHARLQAQNAELLESLKTAHEAMMQASQKSMPAARDVAGAIHQARAAIAKATGEQSMTRITVFCRLYCFYRQIGYTVARSIKRAWGMVK